MTNKEKIIKVGNDNNGYVLSKTVASINIPAFHIRELEKKGVLEKIGFGIYLLKDHPEDELYTDYLRYQRLVYCKRTALYLNGLTNRQSQKPEATFPAGYNASKITSLICHKQTLKKYELGATFVKTPFGNSVKCYDKERCICELYLSDFDNEEKAYAVKAYKASGVNFDKLYEYAKKLGVFAQIKSVFEVL